MGEVARELAALPVNELLEIGRDGYP